MYTPGHFRDEDRERALRLIRENPFATVITAVSGNVLTSFVPCIVVETEPSVILGAHFARANPHWRSIEAAESILIFHGPHAYISPRWYPNPSRNVPTWNYAVVRASASAELLEERELRALLDRLTNEMEDGAQDAWTIDGADPQYIARQIGGIVGARFRVRSLDAKFKLSQNREEIDRAGAMNGLANTDANGRRVATMMAEAASR